MLVSNMLYIVTPGNVLQLLDLMYLSTTYIQTRHPYGEIPGQPQASEGIPVAASQSNNTLTNGHGAGRPQSPQPNGPPRTQADEPETASSTPPPEQSDVFGTSLRELAQAIVLKEQQAEVLINSLPGLRNSEAAQERRMRELDVELQEVGRQRAKAEDERQRTVDALGDLIGKVKRVP